MKRAIILAGFCSLALGACVSNHADRFYILNPLPAAPTPARTSPVTQATLRVMLPAWIDRPEMVVDTSHDSVTILEHERWAAPLSDLVTQALSTDLERRRADLVISDLGVSHATAFSNVIVSVSKVSIHRGEHVRMEAAWRIVVPSTGSEMVRSRDFSAPLSAQGYEAVAQALSDCIGQLADKIVAELPQAP